MTKKEFKTQAIITVSNLGGIEIMLDYRGDSLYYRWSYGSENEQEINEAEIEYDEQSDPFFSIGEVRYYLNEAMRVNN
jgi:hypothetical protein